MKREFLQLAHTYKNQYVSGWMVSVKLDGIRAFWDGGITKRHNVKDVPWANVEKDKKEIFSTGLWSRYGKVIHAPEYWTALLPNVPLDGELYIPNAKWEEISSVVKRHTAGIEWEDVQYMVFDSPRYEEFFADGEINNPNYSKMMRSDWAHQYKLNQMERVRYEWLYLRMKKFENEYVKIHEQAVTENLEKMFEETVESGGEGLILRNPSSVWEAKRSHNILKYKPYNDDEATVIGYVWGRETDKGSKLLGMMGAMIINYKGKILKLSAFTDSQRIMEGEGYAEPGEEVSASWTNPLYPIGSKITFRYRELSAAGIPKEARFLRKYNE